MKKQLQSSVPSGLIRQGEIDSFKTIIGLMHQLSSLPNFHGQVKTFVISIMKLKKISLIPFDDIGASDAELKNMLEEAYSRTISDLALVVQEYSAKERIHKLMEEYGQALEILGWREEAERAALAGAYEKRQG